MELVLHAQQIAHVQVQQHLHAMLAIIMPLELAQFVETAQHYVQELLQLLQKQILLNVFPPLQLKFTIKLLKAAKLY
jgi:predicted AAA+ superfamily ATPase